MKNNKYRKFRVEFQNGITAVLKAPQNKLPLKTAELYAPHWYERQIAHCDINQLIVKEIIGL